MTAMKPRTDKLLHLLSLVAGVAALLFGLAGVVRVMGWLPASTHAFGGTLGIAPHTAEVAGPMFVQVILPAAREASNAPRRRRCAECGVITSVQEVKAGAAAGDKGKAKRSGSAKRYEFIVRLDDGSHRVIGDANPAAWRLGERVSIIDGMNPAN